MPVQRPPHRVAAPLLAILLLSACATTKPAGRPVTTPITQGPRSHGPSVVDTHVPDFANARWAPFSRIDATAIALREWRLFGQLVDDDPPDTRPPLAPEDKPERKPGLWQRVGEYWWEGQDPGELEVAWTGLHDASGQVIQAGQDSNLAWSAAFISYVMRLAGAGPDFPYAPNHSTYINAAASGSNKLLRAVAPQAEAPALGDLICVGRGKSALLRFIDLPIGGNFPSHCDIVVAIAPGQLTVIGGNVDDAVTMKHVPVTPAGLLATPDGAVLDTRYPWLAVLKVKYED